MGLICLVAPSSSDWLWWKTKKPDIVILRSMPKLLLDLCLKSKWLASLKIDIPRLPRASKIRKNGYGEKSPRRSWQRRGLQQPGGASELKCAVCSSQVLHSAAVFLVFFEEAKCWVLDGLERLECEKRGFLFGLCKSASGATAWRSDMRDSKSSVPLTQVLENIRQHVMMWVARTTFLILPFTERIFTFFFFFSVFHRFFGYALTMGFRDQQSLRYELLGNSSRGKRPERLARVVPGQKERISWRDDGWNLCQPRTILTSLLGRKPTKLNDVFLLSKQWSKRFPRSAASISGGKLVALRCDKAILQKLHWRPSWRPAWHTWAGSPSPVARPTQEMVE